jgi:hypothetical protein
MPKNYIQKFRMVDGVLQLSLSKLNDMVEALNYLQQGTLDKNHGRCYVRNMSGAALTEPFQILGIDTNVFDPETDKSNFNLYPTFEGITPEAATHSGKFVVCKEPVEENAIVECVIFGITPCLVNVVDALHEYAAITDGAVEYLTSTSGGGSAKILWKEDGTGELWAIVILGVQTGTWLHKSTSAETNGKINAKLVMSNGYVTGEDIEFIVVPEVDE